MGIPERCGRLVLGLEYDGKSFSGWQTQSDRSSVQDNLEVALSGVANHKIKVVSAGRTDAGVHAVGQVVHFDTSAKRELTGWIEGTNSLLKSGISVTWAKVVSQEFHARYSALSRTYTYLILNRLQRPGVLHGKVGWFKKKLSVNHMKEASKHLIGLHDFSSFRAAACQSDSPLRKVSALNIAQCDNLIRIDITANAFLHHMVRNIVGSLVEVGVGKQTPEWIFEILIAKNRDLAGPTFSPDGLFLAKVSYDLKWNIPGSGKIPFCFGRQHAI